jgi:hypothetical protein
MLLMFFGAGQLVDPYPNDGTCRAAFWMINLGW